MSQGDFFFQLLQHLWNLQSHEAGLRCFWFGFNLHSHCQGRTVASGLAQLVGPSWHSRQGKAGVNGGGLGLLQCCGKGFPDQRNVLGGLLHQHGVFGVHTVPMRVGLKRREFIMQTLQISLQGGLLL